MDNKLGSYILNLMATIKDVEEKQFVRDLAFNELKRLNVDLDAFLIDNSIDEMEKQREKTEKQLLQEEKDGKK
tara:strand:- start:900 stop:1118 length:219 start_codon:yes stop_codon:yes gene_type:complete